MNHFTISPFEGRDLHPSKGEKAAYHIFNLIILLFTIFVSCSREKDPVVARFGDQAITLQEFRIAYLETLKNPRVFDSKQGRDSFLDELINRRLLAKEARQRGFAADEEFRYQVEAYHDKCLRDEHYQRVIEPRIGIDEEQLRQTASFMQEQRRIKHLFFTNQAQADSAHRLLQRGDITFEELARIVFRDTALAASGGDLGWVDWDQMDYDLATTAFTADLNTISKPVWSSFGYHIIKVVEWKKNPLFSEYEYQKSRENVKNILSNKLGAKIAYEYIEDLMSRTRIKLRSETLQFVGAELQALLERMPADSASIPLTSDELETVRANLWSRRNDPMIFIDDHSITIGQFVAQLVYIPRNAFKKSYKTVLDYAIRDFRLTQDAREMGLDKSSKAVRLKSDLFADYRLQIMLRKNIIENISITDEEIREKYEELTAGKSIDLPFQAYRDVLVSNLLTDKKISQVPKFIQQLRQNLIIEKNDEPIHSYYNSIENP